MDRDVLVRDTYAHFGLAMYQAQVLEHGVVNAMVYARMVDSHRITRGEIDAFMGKQFEKTLGTLLRELRKYVRVSDELAVRLAEALRLRNYLAHDYFREHATDFMTDAGCHAMLDELQAWQGLLHDASAALTELVRPIGERFGITSEAIAAEAGHMVEEAEEAPSPVGRSTQALPPVPDEATVKAAVDAALAGFMTYDARLLEFDVNERSVSHRLAFYLQAFFPDWDVDCEYNRDVADPKVLDRPDEAIAWDDGEAKTVFPDVIVHIRGLDHNLLVIEMKKTGRGRKADFDRDKIAAYLNQFGYRFGVFIPFTTGTGIFGPLEWRKRP